LGAKTNIDQASTLTPEQKVLMDSMMRGVTDQMQGFILGEGWGGPSFSSYNSGSGYGGKAWNTARPVALTGAGARPEAGRPGADPREGGANGGGGNDRGRSLTGQAIAGMAPIASAPGTGPSGPGGFVNPFASYSNRDQIVNPIVNPFRRNLGG